MPNQSKLLESNPQLAPQRPVEDSPEQTQTIHLDTRNLYRTSKVPNSLQIALGEAYSAAADLSLNSLDLEALCVTDELRFELNPSRFSFLHSINFAGVDHCLDLTQDFGGVAHYLASQCRLVDAVRTDIDAARLTSERCHSALNLNLICANLNSLKLPKQHYDLIVIGEAEGLQLSRDERNTLLARLRDSLSSKGVIVLNTPNQSDINHSLSGAWHDDSVPYQGLYTDNESGFQYSSLRRDIKNSGFKHSECYASYSSGREISNLLSAEYLSDSDSALNHFYRLGALENDSICEYLLFRKLARHDANPPSALLENASRLVFFLSQDVANSQALIDLSFAHYPGRSRQPEWRTITERRNGSQTVTKRHLYSELNNRNERSNEFIAQNLVEQDFQSGTILVAQWLDAALNRDLEQFTQLVADYQNWLTDFAQTDGEAFQISAYDLLPFNIIDSGDSSAELSQRYQAIDPEWELLKPLSVNFVLFRALFWFAFENRAVLQGFSAQLNLSTLAHFVSHFHPSLDSDQALDQCVALEESIQSQIDSNFRAGAVSQALSQSIRVSTDQTCIETAGPTRSCQVQWGHCTTDMDSASARLSEWQVSLDSTSTIQLALPARRAGYSVLRIDPMECGGLFRMESLVLATTDNQPVMTLGSASACASAAELVNIELEDDAETCIALNQDPHFLFDLSEQPNLDDAVLCTIQIRILHTPEYKGALETLTHTLSEQKHEQTRLVNKLNTLAAELEFTQQRLGDAVEHRTDLNELLNEVQREKRANASNYNLQLHEQRAAAETRYANRVRALNRRLTNLNDQLIDQIRHNQAVDLYLIQRPSTRAKRLLSRLVQRVTGRAAVGEQDATTGNDVADENTQAELVLPADQPEQSIAGQPQANESTPAPTETATAEPVQEQEELIGQNRENYQLWLKQNELTAEQISSIKTNIESLPVKPTFSILVPIYNTDPDYLLPMIRSVQAQVYPHWQLVLVDDCSPKKWLRTILDIEAAKDQRITLQINEENQGIALTSNDALALAHGDYIALLDHDDELSIDALYENAKVINQRPDVGLIYSDEDKMDLKGNRLEPYFKPDYSPDLLDTNNYICHFTVIKKTIADRIGGFRATLDGSQDHDIILRAIAESGQVVHIPKILYHWRKIPGSTAVAYDSKSYAWEAGRRAVEDCLKQHDDTARVEFGSLKGTYRVFREIRGEPLVSIIIPFKDKPELLRACIGSILAQSSYPHFEIVGVNNSSSQAETFTAMEQLAARDARVRFVDKDMPFNFSAICNYGVEQAKGEYVLLLNNDVTLDGADWLERLLEHAQRAEIGAVGGKLLYPDGRIQHAGIVAGMVGTAGHPHKFFPDNHIGYHGRLHMVYNVSAVTGAMLMVRKDKYLQVGGLDEDNFAVAYNDVDFCLKLMDAGYINLFTPHSRGIHHESVSRGYEDTDEKLARLKREQNHFLSKWADFLRNGDPYYNPNLSLLNEHFSLKFEQERSDENKH